MDSLVYSNESASNAGRSDSTVDLDNTSPEWLLELIKAHSTMDRDSYKQLLNIVNRYVSLQCAVNRRSYSSNGSVSDNGSSSSISGGSRAGARNAKLDTIKRAASWRANLRSTPVVPYGYCYVKMLESRGAELQSMRLGGWPTVASLLQTAVGSYKSLDELMKLRVYGDKSKVHVLSEGEACSDRKEKTFSLLASLSTVAEGLNTAPGTLGSVVRGKPKGHFGEGMRVFARTAVGGSSGSGGGQFDSASLASVFAMDSSVEYYRSVVSDTCSVRWVEAFAPGSGGKEVRYVMAVTNSGTVVGVEESSRPVVDYAGHALQVWVPAGFERKGVESPVVRALFAGTAVRINSGVPTSYTSVDRVSGLLGGFTAELHVRCGSAEMAAGFHKLCASQVSEELAVMIPPLVNGSLVVYPAMTDSKARRIEAEFNDSSVFSNFHCDVTVVNF